MAIASKQTTMTPNRCSHYPTRRRPLCKSRTLLLIKIIDLCISNVERCGKNYKSSAVAEMGDRGNNRHGPKRGGVCPFLGGAGSRLTQCGLGRDLLPSQVATSSIQPFGHNRHERKTGGCAPFRGRNCDPI